MKSRKRGSDSSDDPADSDTDDDAAADPVLDDDTTEGTTASASTNDLRDDEYELDPSREDAEDEEIEAVIASVEEDLHINEDEARHARRALTKVRSLSCLTLAIPCLFISYILAKEARKTYILLSAVESGPEDVLRTIEDHPQDSVTRGRNKVELRLHGHRACPRASTGIGEAIRSARVGCGWEEGAS